MLLPIEWLKSYVNIEQTDRELADGLTLSGSHVESINKKMIQGVYTGRIEEITAHPQADKLRICQVNVGGRGQYQIVTGATNVEEGHVVPVALPGAVLAGGLKIKSSELRGISSDGMLCSFEELGYDESVIPKESRDGIMIFTEEVALGEDVATLFHLDESVIEFEITPNRPDCLGILGMAKETAATFDSQYRAPEGASLDREKACEVQVTVETEGCLRYMGQVMENIKIKPSPLWMQLRLMAAGVRPINNIVDITNYIMLEYNQPLHAFDADKIAGKHIIVRQGKPDEELTLLNGSTKAVLEQDVVIADEDRVLGFAGIMGGFESEITEETTRIFLESACFDEAFIRKTSKRLNLRTEASTRFEKGLDPNTAETAVARFCQLMKELGAGEVQGGTVDYYPAPVEPKMLALRPSRVNHLLGLELEKSFIINALERLQMVAVEDGELLQVTVPTYRGDISREADLIEEVGRIYGFHRIAPKPLAGELMEGGREPLRVQSDKVRDLMVSLGYDQLLTYSFISPKAYDKCRLADDDPIRDSIKILNPLGEDFSIMRRTLIPNLLEVLARNANRGIENFKGFEIGRIFIAKDKDLNEDPHEPLTLAIGAYDVDFYELKEVLSTVLCRSGIDEFTFVRETAHPAFHPGRTARVLIAGKDVGIVGEIHPKVADNYGIKKVMMVAEIDLEQAIDHMDDRRTYKPWPKHPAVSRDLATVVKEDIMVGDMESIVHEQGRDWVEAFTLFDIYRGDQIAEGMKSVAFSITFRHPERTLKDEEVAEVMESIKSALEKELDATWR